MRFGKITVQNPQGKVFSGEIAIEVDKAHKYHILETETGEKLGVNARSYYPDDLFVAIRDPGEPVGEPVIFLDFYGLKPGVPQARNGTNFSNGKSNKWKGTFIMTKR